MSRNANAKETTCLGLRVLARMRFLYGNAYNELSACRLKGPSVGDLLVGDAVRSGIFLQACALRKKVI